MNERQKKIVIVEDDPKTAEMFAEMMRLSGFEVLISVGGASALKLIKTEKPDAVIMDFMMPDLSGLEILKTIRMNPSLEHIPVVMVSASNLPMDINAVLMAGASIYLKKPVAFQDLKDAVLNTI